MRKRNKTRNGTEGIMVVAIKERKGLIGIETEAFGADPSQRVSISRGKSPRITPKRPRITR